MSDAKFDPIVLADALREARRAVVEAAERLPESRMYGATGRAGWTVKHELSQLAARDAELLHLLGAAPAGGTAAASALRRVRGSAMHTAHLLRLEPLRAHLADLGERTAGAVEAAADRLAAPLPASDALGGTLADLVAAQVERARSALEAMHRHTPEG